MKGMSFALNPFEEEQVAFSATNVHAEVWHKRLGHFNHATIMNLFMNCATKTHLIAAKRFLRYVRGALVYGVRFCANQDYVLQGYSDSDWGGSLDDLKSTSVAQSTIEAEFIIASVAINQALWLRKVLVDLNLKQERCTKLFIDNQASISISNNPVFHGKTKHYNIKLFSLREVQKEGSVGLKYCKFEFQLTDM
ncbi:hypothetical protein V6Z12_D02G124600 [Gossypium hirsutum]